MATPMQVDRNITGDLAAIGVRLLDDAHLTWVAAEVESEHALHAWFDAAAPHRRDSYLAYRAAADREQAAAGDLQRLCELTHPYQELLARRH